MIYLYLFGTCFHFIYVFMIIGNIHEHLIVHHLWMQGVGGIECPPQHLLKTGDGMPLQYRGSRSILNPYSSQVSRLFLL